MRTRHPLSALATVDPVLRDAVIFDVVMDSPRTVALRHDIIDSPDGGALRRVVVDATGVVEDLVVPLAHACLSCSVREDAIPTLARLAEDPRWDAILLALPVSAESLPVTRALEASTGRGGELQRLRLASVLTAVDGSSFGDDLLGDDRLDERGIALTEDDDRCVSEALVAQVGHADMVLVAGGVTSAGAPLDDRIASDLVDHIRAGGSVRFDGLHSFDARELFRGRHDGEVATRRLDPLLARAVPGAPEANGVWTIELDSDRPFHPDRLVSEVERLGQGRFRSRGHFWVPSRPDSVCFWDAAGGQLSLGAMGHWGRRAPRTRLVVTGVGDGREELREAFADMLMSVAELDQGLHPWLGRADVLEPWLGERSAA